MRSKAFADVGAACASVLRSRKSNKTLLPSLEDLSFVLNSSVDHGTIEVFDMVYLPLSLVFNASMEEKRGRGNGEGDILAGLPSVQREKVTLAALDCLEGLIRMLRQSLKKKTVVGEGIEKFTTSILLWLSYFLQYHAKFSEEVNMRVAEMLCFCYKNFLPLAIKFKQTSAVEGDGEELLMSQILPHVGCHIAFTLDQAEHVSSKGAQGSKKLVKDVLVGLNTIIAYLAQDHQVLAFFLPGIVSKLSLLLLQAVGKSKKAISLEAETSQSLRQCVTGPMASSGCVEQALACLTSTIIFCFKFYQSEENRGTTEEHIDNLHKILSNSQGHGQGKVAKENNTGSVARDRKTPGQFVVHCDQQWYSATFLKVEDLARHYLPDLCGHSSHVVRKCIMDTISKVMKSCAQFEISRSFLECALALAHDEEGFISEKASELVYAFGERYRTNKKLQWRLLEQVDTLFIDYVSKLVPAAKHTSSLVLLAKKLSSLLCLGKGMYIMHLYKEKLDHLTNFIDALRQCFSFDVLKTMESGGPLIWMKNPHRGEGHNLLGEAAAVLPRMQSNFAFLHTLEDYHAAAMVCRTLGIISLTAQLTSNVPVFDYIVRHYLTLFESPEKESHSWFLRAMSFCTMMSETIVGCDEKSRDDAGLQPSAAIEATRARQREYVSSAISLMIEEQSSETMWASILVGSHSRSTQLACVFLESFGAFARVLGPPFTEKYEFLPTALFALLEKFGDDRNMKVQTSAELSLRCICCHCNYSSIPDLLFKNSDYLIDTLVIRLMHLELYPETTRLFKAVVSVVQSSDNNFLAFVNLIREPFQMIAQNMSVYARHLYSGHVANYVGILRLLSDVCHQGAKAMALGVGLLDDRKDDEDEPYDRDNDEGYEEIALFISETSASIALQCSELLHSEQFYWELLGAIESSVSALAICQSLPEKEGKDKFELTQAEQGSTRSNLFPTIASIWPQLMTAVNRNSKLRNRCLKTLSSVVNCGGKFLMSRVTKELWPCLDALWRHGPSQAKYAALEAFSAICDSKVGRTALAQFTSLRCAKTLTSLLKKQREKSDDAKLLESLVVALSKLKEVDADAVFGFLLCLDTTPPLSEAPSPRRFEVLEASIAL
ncbi:hypothetical protein HOP50_20g85530 [Chloropicon primus]|nr:hypothetical protein HOP50_20g85530 [Chloropicon primus]